MKKMFLFCGISICLISCNQDKKEAPVKLTLPSIFSNHMVLQQQSEAAIWGWQGANDKISVSGSWGKNSTSVSDNNGAWKIELETPKAGGPYDLTISNNDTTIIFNDVMIGEVWLASGQSNMEMPLLGFPPNELIDDFENEIATADYPDIRFINVPNVINTTPQKDFEGSWEPIQQSTAGKYSATAYFFAKNLVNELKVPIGIISSDWGGTPVEAWTSREKLLNLKEFNKELVALSAEKMKTYMDWVESFPTATVPKNEDDWNALDLQDAEMKEASYDDSNWNITSLPALFRDLDLVSQEGGVWFRKKVILTDVNQNYTFSVEEGIDDLDQTYFNGKRIGGMVCWNCPREYTIPKEILKKGENTIAVRVIDTYGLGGFAGKVSLKNANQREISVSEDWRYHQVADYKFSKFLVLQENNEAYENQPKGIEDFSFSASSPTVLFNGMIAPIVPYKIKGAIWYQGESNVGREKQYEKVFQGMIGDWRERWDDEFSFYFVQIAPFSYENERSPALRDAQRKSLKTAKTGMAITMDIGNSSSIHPGNKQSVGERLANLALGKDYGIKMISSGPLYKNQTIEGNKIVLSFDHVGGGLVSKNGPLKDFEIAGANRQYFTAKAKIIDDRVQVSALNVIDPKFVRYGWKDYLLPTLFNKEGLPASSFCTED